MRPVIVLPWWVWVPGIVAIWVVAAAVIGVLLAPVVLVLAIALAVLIFLVVAHVLDGLVGAAWRSQQRRADKRARRFYRERRLRKKGHL